MSRIRAYFRSRQAGKLISGVMTVSLQIDRVRVEGLADSLITLISRFIGPLLNQVVSALDLGPGWKLEMRWENGCLVLLYGERGKGHSRRWRVCERERWAEEKGITRWSERERETVSGKRGREIEREREREREIERGERGGS